MEYKDFDNKVTNMLEKIGDDSANLIFDDVAILLTDNKNMNELINQKEEEISKLKNLNSRLQQVNGNLLLQIPVQKEERIKESSEDKPKYNLADAFDENGRFRR